MKKTISPFENVYIGILREELLPAFGCTEPIALSYAAAKARAVLGEMPERIIAGCSGNIIKNVKGVIVPGTVNLRGISAAALLGAVGGNPERGLEVLEGITAEHLAEAKRLLDEGVCREELLDTPAKLHIVLTACAGVHSATVEILHQHMNVVRIEKDGEILLENPTDPNACDHSEFDRDLLNMEGIFAFAEQVEISLVSDVLERQIAYNTAISQEGLVNTYGACVGSTLLQSLGNDISIRAKAAAAAGSDARMGGCEMPVIINSGSGNQGLTVSLPVIEYAAELGASKEKLYRALCLSNLVSIYQKSKIGRLSAYCGAVNAAAGAGAGIMYLLGGGFSEISEAVTSTLANVSGIVCDGAKASCAAKIASSVDAAIMACMMTMQNRRFHPGEGIVKQTIEKTIDCVSSVARDGMRETDEQILKLMIDAH